MKTSSNHPVPEYQLPLDVREHARAKSISFEHKVQAGGHSDSASSRGNLNFHAAELLIDRFVRRTKRREEKEKKKGEKEEVEEGVVESDGQGRGRSLALIFVSNEIVKKEIVIVFVDLCVTG